MRTLAPALLVAIAIGTANVSLLAQPYDPSAVAVDRQAETIDLAIEDQARQREIPVRMFLPAETGSAAVILFSHGLGGSRRACAYLGRHWSARGYVVVFLQHAGSDEAIWKDVPLAQRLAAMRAAPSVQNTVARFRDVSAVLDQLSQWNDNDKHRFHGRFDLQRVGMSGHSYGAITTQGVSGQSAPGLGQRFTDPRIRAAIMFSPNSPDRVEPAQAFGSVSIPWMLMTGTKDTSPINDTTVADRRRVYPALPSSIDKYELVLQNAEHSAFTDNEQPRRRLRRNPNHHRVILALSTAFWDAHLRNNTEARDWLHGQGARSRLDQQDVWQINSASDQAPSE